MQKRRRPERAPCAVARKLALGDSVQLAIQLLEELLRGGGIAFLRRREQRGNRRFHGDISKQCASAEVYDIRVRCVTLLSRALSSRGALSSRFVIPSVALCHPE